MGRVVRTYEKGLYTDMTYSMQGDMITKLSMGKEKDPETGTLTVYIYDENGKLTDAILQPGYEADADSTGFFVAEDSVVTHAEYDKAGNMTGYSYDESGQLLSITLPGEAKGTLSDLKYEYSYDVDNGDSTTKDVIKDPKGNKSGEETIFSYNSYNQLRLL